MEEYTWKGRCGSDLVVVSVSGWGSIQTPNFQESDAWNNIPLSIMKRSSSQENIIAAAEQCPRITVGECFNPIGSATKMA